MRRQTALCSAILFGVSLLATHAYRAQPLDDAFIVFRYVLNLLQHGEWVWNLGERVEGSTSLLWPLLIAGFARVASGGLAQVAIPHVAVELSSLLHAGTSVVLWRVLTRLGLGAWSALAWALGFQLMPDVLGMALNGLETQLCSFLLALLLVAVVEHRASWVGVIGVALFATRPEGALVAVATCAIASRLRWRRHSLQWLVLAAGIASIEAFRWSYYGAWLPNPVTAKSIPLAALPDVALRLGVPYVAKFLASPPWLALTMLSVASAYLGVRSLRGLERIIALLPLVTVALALAIVLRNGGDWMPNFRLILQYGPWLIPSVAVVSRALQPRWQSALVLLGLSPLLAHALDSVPWGMPSWVRVDAKITPIFERVAERLPAVARPDDVVASEMAGVLPYRLASLRAHDPCGLTDRTIAERGTPAPPFGRDLPEHTLFEVRPSFAVFHAAAHVLALDARRLDQTYLGLCERECGCRDPEADILLIRRDRVTPDVLARFGDFRPWSARCARMK